MICLGVLWGPEVFSSNFRLYAIIALAILLKFPSNFLDSVKASSNDLASSEVKFNVVFLLFYFRRDFFG